MEHLSEQEIQRRDSLIKLRELGIDPYPAEEFKFTNYSNDIKANFNVLEGKNVIIAGRIMSRRIMGKASFIEIKDFKGRIQVYINKDDISNDEEGTMYNIVFKKLLDIGDIIGISGFIFKTKMGEISVHAKKIKILSKALRPLPIVKTDENGNIHDSFSDIELRYRQRYVDLIVNENIKDIFIKRTKIMNIMRDFFNEKEYFEVETPILQAIPGGATARPFITHHNTLDIPLYLRIANELYLKRLIVGGFDGVYEFSKDFRNEGMDRTHNPEFTVMELYIAYKDYNWMMDMTEILIHKIVNEIHKKDDIIVGENTINFKPPYKRISILDAIKETIGIDISNMNEAELKDLCNKINVEVNETMGKGKIIDEIFGKTTEHKLINPTFITDYPIEMSPLTKKHRGKEGLTERFELIINGKEIANSYSELNDPIDQRERFEQQLKLSEKGDDEAMFIDHDFLKALEYGMPPTAGIGIGIDRLVMLMTNQSSIQEVLFFPQMRPEKKKNISLLNFEKSKIPKEWAEIMVKSGYGSIQKIKETKITILHQALNNFRKKNKLNIPSLSLEEIERWEIN